MKKKTYVYWAIFSLSTTLNNCLLCRLQKMSSEVEADREKEVLVGGNESDQCG